ncbi:MAG: hypothetical protein ICV60_19775 [Pyrinomonadaceae bacterium]|nr:hypothetical protein [Pyrinomonadaceae bacterium]
MLDVFAYAFAGVRTVSALIVKEKQKRRGFAIASPLYLSSIHGSYAMDASTHAALKL